MDPGLHPAGMTPLTALYCRHPGGPMLTSEYVPMDPGLHPAGMTALMALLHLSSPWRKPGPMLTSEYVHVDPGLHPAGMRH